MYTHEIECSVCLLLLLLLLCKRRATTRTSTKCKYVRLAYLLHFAQDPRAGILTRVLKPAFTAIPAFAAHSRSMFALSLSICSLCLQAYMIHMCVYHKCTLYIHCLVRGRRWGGRRVVCGRRANAFCVVMRICVVKLFQLAVCMCPFCLCVLCVARARRVRCTRECIATELAIVHTRLRFCQQQIIYHPRYVCAVLC